MDRKPKIVQLIPADGWLMRSSVIGPTDGLMWQPVVAWGLQDNGKVVALYHDGFGELADVADHDRFEDLCHPAEQFGNGQGTMDGWSQD